MNNTLCVTFLAKKLNVLECFQFILGTKKSNLFFSHTSYPISKKFPDSILVISNNFTVLAQYVIPVNTFIKLW